MAFAPRARVSTYGKRSEKQVQQEIIELLKAIGASVYVLGTRRRTGDYPGTMQTPGIPDLWVFLPHRPGRDGSGLWVEVKTPIGRPSQDQHAFANWCSVYGVPYVCGGAGDVAEFLKTGGWLK